MSCYVCGRLYMVGWRILAIYLMAGHEIHNLLRASNGFCRSTLRVIKILSQLTHPNIMKWFLLTAEHMNGGSLVSGYNQPFCQSLVKPIAFVTDTATVLWYVQRKTVSFDHLSISFHISIFSIIPPLYLISCWDSHKLGKNFELCNVCAPSCK